MRLKRLFDAFKSGVADLTDSDLKVRIVSPKPFRDQSPVDADCALAMLQDASQKAITARFSPNIPKPHASAFACLVAASPPRPISAY